MNISELLSRFGKLGIMLWADGNRLQFDAPAGALTQGLRNELLEHKVEILQFLVDAQDAAYSIAGPITPTPRGDTLTLSFAQQRLWFMNQLVPDSAFYNIPAAPRLLGLLDRPALQWSLDRLVLRHEALRTIFRVANGEPFQLICPPKPVEMALVDLSDLPREEREAEARRLAGIEARGLFNLTLGPLLRVRLLRLSEQEHILALTMHHIISDGWSIGILVRDLAELYTACVEDRAPALPELPIQYPDFARWQKEWLRGERINRQLTYWKQQLKDLPPVQLPTDHTPPAELSYRGQRRIATLDEDQCSLLNEMSKREGVTLFMTTLATFNLLLYRYTGETDIAVGAPIANRNRAELEDLVGFFVNSLVMRTDVSGDPTFRELLHRVHDVALEAFANQDLPFEKLVEELNPERDLSHNPLYQISFAFQEDLKPSAQLGGVSLSFDWAETYVTRFDLEAHLYEDKGELKIMFIYNTDLFEDSTIQRMLGHYQILLAGIVENPDQVVSQLPLVSPAERQQLLYDWNKTGRAYPQNLMAHEMFEEQAASTPHTLAVACGNDFLSYRELNQRANRLAHLLRGKGVKPNRPVAVLMERSPDFVVAILGVLKAGGAYVPLDPTYPKHRLAFMLRDSEASILLTQLSLGELDFDFTGDLVYLDSASAPTVQEISTNPASPVHGENLAYVIYTSGSTGQPNGVQIAHNSLLNLIYWHRRTYNLTLSDRATQLASLSFDASVWELWPYLTSGASIHFVEHGIRSSPLKLWTWLAEHKITIAFMPTPLAEAALQQPLPDDLVMRTLLIGGDRMRSGLRESLPFDVVNHYGPTENTVVTTCGIVDNPASDTRPPSIGRPIDNVEVYLLDKNRQPVPIGVRGELYIGGASLAQGYCNRPEHTKARFIPHLFKQDTKASLYKTGDLCRWRSDGAIEFLGRNDNQLKIRGFRIELGEIESTLSLHPAVQQALIVVHEDEPESQQLAAYLVVNESGLSESGTPGNPEWVNEHVAQWEALYEETYAQPSPESNDPVLNISGWNSSYSGEPIPAVQMREWVDVTVQRIMAFQPRRVLEIGCGTGLLLYRLAPHCQTYFGSDFSRQALDQVRVQRDGHEDLAHVHLSRRMADDFDAIEPRSFDTVVINSVVQYFPGIAYLKQVLEGAVETVIAGGRIFVGDVRSLPLSNAYHASVQFHSAAEEDDGEKLNERITRAIEREQELLIDPEFFNALKKPVPRISHVEILLKRGKYENELTRFRYDVVLHVETDQTPINVGDRWMDWRRDELSLSRVGELLADGDSTGLGIHDVPNARLQMEAALLTWLSEGERETRVKTVRRACETAEDTSIDPEALWEIAADAGCSLELSYAQSKEMDKMDALFKWPQAAGLKRGVYWPCIDRVGCRPWRSYANNPLKGRLIQHLKPQLREFLRDRLPEYMVPVAYTFIDEIPLTTSGKVNHRSLWSSAQTRSGANDRYVAPRDDIDRRLIDVWENFLTYRPVGIKDNFFDLGGHSLLGVRLISEIEKTIGIELPLETLFRFSTVEQMADTIRSRQTASSHEEAVQKRIGESGLSKKDYKDMLAVLASGKYLPTSPGSLMTTINKFGNGQPLFWCFNVPSFEPMNLAKYLSNEQPVYGFFSGARLLTDSEGGELGWEEFAECVSVALAKQYIAELMTVQPNGPYLIGGNCAGAHIACEMANQLVSRGSVVKRLCLMEYFDPRLFKYPGKMLLLYGKESHLKAYEAFHWLEEGWADAFNEVPEVSWIPGAHGSFFSEPNVGELANKITRFVEADS